MTYQSLTPLENSSGSGAKGSLQYNLEIKTFYERRLELGKSKMSTINIIRNKLIARMFAVIKRNSPYVDFMKYAA